MLTKKVRKAACAASFIVLISFLQLGLAGVIAELMIEECSFRSEIS
jgi:hypothetical protein